MSEHKVKLSRNVVVLGNHHKKNDHVVVDEKTAQQLTALGAGAIVKEVNRQIEPEKIAKRVKASEV
jgi:hypothetical protein